MKILRVAALLGSSLALAEDPYFDEKGNHTEELHAVSLSEVGGVLNQAINRGFAARGWGKVRFTEVISRRQFRDGGSFSHMKATDAEGNAAYLKVSVIKGCDMKKRFCDAGSAKENRVEVVWLSEDEVNEGVWSNLVEEEVTP